MKTANVKAPAADPDAFRRSRVTLSNHTLAMKLAEIQPSRGCTVDLVTLADILANYAMSESLTPSPDSGEAAERIDAVALCSQVSRDNSHNRNLELIEGVLNAIDQDARWYANGVGVTSEDDETTHALADICEASVAEIERIADVLGCWISWFEDADQPKYKPANYWREVPASDGRLSARRSRIAAVASKFTPATDKAGVVANAQIALELIEAGLPKIKQFEDVKTLAQRVIALCAESKSSIPHPGVVKVYADMASWVNAILGDYAANFDAASEGIYARAKRALLTDGIRKMKVRRK